MKIYILFTLYEQKKVATGKKMLEKNTPNSQNYTKKQRTGYTQICRKKQRQNNAKVIERIV